MLFRSLVQYYAHGLNYTDGERLKKEVIEANTPEGNPFLKQVNAVKSTATKMLTQSLRPTVIAHPDVADEASYRFGIWLDDQIKAERAKPNGDVQSLFRPGSPNYVLDPNRVAGFMPSESEIKAREAGGLTPAVAPHKISTDAEFDALPHGAVFVAPDGSTRRKP